MKGILPTAMLLAPVVACLPLESSLNALFPFELNFTQGALRRSSVLQVDRQGLDEDVIRFVR